MVVNIKATGIELTEKINDYAHKKFESVTKYFDNIQKIDIDIGIRTNHHQKGKIFYAETNIHVPGKIIRVVKDSEDLYKAIDKVKDHLKVEFEKLKGKMRNKNKKVLRGMKAYQDQE